jgi:hypothetical protein
MNTIHLIRLLIHRLLIHAHHGVIPIERRHVQR